MADAEIQLMTNKRKGMRGQCATLCETIQKDCEAEISDKAAWRSITAKLECLDERERDLKEMDRQLLALVKPEFFEGVDYQRELMQVDRYALLIRETRLLVKEKNPIKDNSKNLLDLAALTLLSKKERKVKLPVLELPTFDGEIIAFQPFIQSFNESIGDDTQLSDLDKFKYLKSYVKGEAAKVLQPIPVRGDNLKLAIDTLTRNFGRIEIVVHAHLQALQDMKPVTEINKVKQLRDLLSTLEMHVRSIQNLGVQPGEYNLLLFHKVSNLLPAELVLRYCQQEGEAEVDKLLEWLRQEVAHRGRCQLLVHRVDGVKDRIIKPIKTAAALYTGEESEEEVGAMATGVAAATSKIVNAKKREVRPFCALCFDYGHWTDQCAVERTWNDKRTLLRKRGRCFKCASRDHMANDCQNPRAVCQQCTGRHFTVLCPAKGAEDVAVSSMAVQAQPRVSQNLLQTAHAVAKGKGVQRDVRVLFDGGSQCTFVKDELVKRLKLVSCDSVRLKLNIFGGESSLKKCSVVMVPLSDRKGNVVCVVRALVVPTLSVQHLAYCAEPVRQRCRQQGLELADEPIWPAAKENDDIDLLIGVDYYWQIVEPQVQAVGENLMAMKTKLGWVIQGVQPVLVTEPRVDEVAVDFVGISTEAEEVEYEHLWKFDAIGVSEPQHMEEMEPVEIEWVDGRYEVTLPWLVDRRHRLSNNLKVAQQRLHGLICRLEKQPGMLEIYHQAMQQYVIGGHAEEIGTKSASEQGYYLPHRAVIRENTTTDVRVVFDASAKTTKELSLNECISAGKDRHLDLLGVVLRFRRFQWAVVADIKKAFLQISMAEREREYLRFLWLDMEQPVGKPYQVKEYRMSRVTFGVSASPFLLKTVIQAHLENYIESHNEIVKECQENMYVDDMVESVRSQMLLNETQYVLQDIFQKGGFELRKWATNNKRLMEEWKEKGVAVEDKRVIKVLGQAWDIDEDNLWVKVPVQVIEKSTVNSRREILKVMATVFDPLGILSLLSIKAKMLFQRSWLNDKGWDDELEERLAKDWNEWKGEVVNCDKISIPRWSGFSTEKGGELHGFCDASEKAFGVVFFWRARDREGVYRVEFQLAKYRVAPLKEEVKIPRLELMSAFLLAQFTSYWLKETHMEPSRVYLWTDSEIVWNWITRIDRLREVYVQRRLDKIRSLTKIADWRHCPGEQNPADKGTRMLHKITSADIHEWLKGPQWLKNEEDWPIQKVEELQEEEAEQGTYHVAVLPPYWIDVKRFSSWIRLLRVTAWCLRFIRRCRRISTEYQTEKELSWQELKWAERRWIRCVQKKHYGDEIEAVQGGQRIKRGSSLSKFQLFLDSNGVLRIKSRLYEALKGQEIASPVVVPGQEEVVKLYLVFRHELLLHEGCNSLWADSRKRFWITKGRKACKQVVSQCRKCRRVDGPHFSPRTGPLPVERVVPKSAFMYVGLDFAGPIYTKGHGNEKTYVLIITCLYSRAVHVELVSNLTAERFMLAFQRFIARRGQPTVVFSDNALTYKKASKIFKQILATNVSVPKYSFFKLDPLSWKFIPERAPWMGGVWERVVKSVKGILRKVLGQASLTFEELSTVLSVIESVINSRPLTVVSDDVNDEHALTPNHLVTARALSSLPLYDLGRSVPELNLMDRYRYLQTLLQAFNRRWFREYLLQLRNNHQVCHGTVFTPTVGDVVLVELDNVKHHLYPMGRIQKLNVGRDSIVRSAVVRMTTGSLLTRPVKRLYPLEPYLVPGGNVAAQGSG